MEFQEVYKAMLEASSTTGTTATPAEQALTKTGIPPDAPYYAGALRNVEQALASRKPTAAAFWKSYQLSLYAHLEQLQDTEKQAEREMVKDSLRVVQAILYALEA